MANKKGNRLTVRTRQALITAYLELLQESPTRNIKINEICQRADLSRTTFYKHFQTKDEILLTYLDGILEGMFTQFRMVQIIDDSLSDFQNAATHFFELWQTKAELFTLIKVTKTDQLLIGKLKDHHLITYHQKVSPIYSIEDNTVLKYFISNISYVFFSVLEQWMATKMKETPEEMGELLAHLYEPMSIKSIAERYN